MKILTVAFMLLFYRYAGLKLNIDKTEAIWLGRNHRMGKVCNIKIINSPTKVLGIWIAKNTDEITRINLDERIDKLNLQRITMCPHGYHHNGFIATPALGTQEVRLDKLNILLNMWSQRNLSIKGKITILKAKASINNICVQLYFCLQRLYHCN